MKNTFSIDNEYNLRQRILVVDDEPDILDLNTEVLEDCGYLVDAIKDGSAAWEAVQCTRYNLIVTDNNMPGLTGVQLIKKIRAADMALPIIMATGTLPIGEFALNPGIQPTAILYKPYTITELVASVKEALHTVVLTCADKSLPSPNLRRLGYYPIAMGCSLI